MKKTLSPPWLFWLCLLAWLPGAQAQLITARVHKVFIRHVGPPAVSDDYVRANIRAKEGEPLYRATVDEDIASLYRTGYFLQIRVDENNTPDGTDVTYVLQGKPILVEIKIEGNHKMSLKKLTKKLTSKTGEPLDRQKLFEDAVAMQKLYEKAGYQDTKVVVQDPSIDEAQGRATVVIAITETPKVKIKDVVFENVHAPDITQRKLRKVLKTRRHWMFSWLTGTGVLKKDEFEDDKDALVAYYQNAGYIDMTIQDVKFDYVTPSKMIIRIFVSEGQQYKVGTLDIKGNKLFTMNDFIKGVTIDRQMMKLKMVPGEVFKPDAYNKDSDTLRDMYGSRGYLEAPQGTTLINATRTANPTARTMDISYTIEEGEQCFIEKIDIKGNVKTKDKVLRRELAASPGEVYDMVRIKISKERLEGLQYFEKVDTQADDTTVPNKKDLEIGVQEKSTASLTVGAGFSSVESLVGFLEVRQGNFDLFDPPTFTGAGQKFEAKASLGTELQNYEVNFTEPWLFGKRLQLNVDLFHTYNFYDSLNSQYTETFDGGTLSLTKALGDRLRGTVSYTAEQVHVAINSGFTTNSSTNYVTSPNGLSQYQSLTGPNISTNIFDERGSTFVSKVGFSLDYDTRNSYQTPNRGQQTVLTTTVATSPGDADFYKVELKTDWYFKGFFPGHVLELGAKAGSAAPYGNQDHIPIFERYFLGGLYNMRGFRYRQVGPMDQFGEPLGGDTYFYASAEYSIPIIKYLSFLLFYDIGNVYADPWSLKAGAGRVSYSDDYGLGLGILLPVQGGIPLRLYYGIPINHDPNLGSAGRVQIGFGYVHNF